MFKINHLDHVAIYVNDIAASVKWYEENLGLKRIFENVWTPFPAMMVAQSTGVAIFPAKAKDLPLADRYKHRTIDHFAFNISRNDFDKAQEFYTQKGTDFHYQHHTVSESIYLKDPDGHTVELTTYEFL